MTKLLLHLSIAVLLSFCLNSCAVFTKTNSGYTNFTKEHKLDSTQIAYKSHLQKFTKAVLNKKDISNLIADSLYCYWEVGGDSLFISSNSNKISKKDFLKNYSSKVFNKRYVDYINDDKNIFSIDHQTNPIFDNISLNGFNVTFGPKKCIWDPCGYEHIEFIKTKEGYKLYKMWLL